ncbi:MAG: ABC transporter permease [Dehalococcoidia bacterium]|jgi:ABC-2 type transport system permease protein|nr:ABC transporter permease [Dehalococcoidia bacterium]
MTFDRTTAIAVRVMREIVRDRRSLALIFLAPLLVMALVGFSFSEKQDTLDRVAPALISVFTLLFTFVLTGISFLRERSQGTLERLYVTPVGRGDVLVGYLLGFLVFAALQSLIILLFTVFVVDVNYRGDLWQMFVVLMVLTIFGVNLGIFASTFARNEFQVVQFIPMLFAPQIFLSGVVMPVEELPGYFQGPAEVLPLTHAVRALREIMLRGEALGDVMSEIAVLAAYATGLLVVAMATVRRT